MQYGTRIIYNEETGQVLTILGEMEGDLQKGLRPKKIDFIDLPFKYNENNFKNAINFKIDITKDKSNTELKDLIIIENYIENTKSKDEQIQELENKLLLEKEKQLGGII